MEKKCLKKNWNRLPDFVKDMSQNFYSHSLTVLLGKAQLWNVEFFHSGQEGWTDEYDPRYSVAFIGLGRVHANFVCSIVFLFGTPAEHT